MKILKIILIFFCNYLFNQNIDLNNDFNYSLINYNRMNNDIQLENSFNIRPIGYNLIDKKFKEIRTIYTNNSKSVEIKSLGIDYYIEYNTKHPYNRNNGSMIPNRGYQHIISPGLFFKAGPLSIQIKPEHHFAENKIFDGFWDGHYPEIWSKRYRLWNRIDMPERFGFNALNRMKIGQSSIRLNWKKISLGISNENLWWGPSHRNSIMMSNHAEGFKHITFNSIKPLKTFFGSFEFQFITGLLENSGFTPPRPDYEYGGTKLYVPKINQLFETDDDRFLQAFIFSYSPKWIDKFSIGIIRWVQMYSALIEGRYDWLSKNKNYFPIFNQLFRSNNNNVDYEIQTNEAAGIFMKWFWPESKSEIYFEFHLNDSRFNLRDFIVDSDHSRASTIGFQKIFNLNNDNYLFSWEWTQMEQTAGRLLRNAYSWYEHYFVYDGYTNKGEVLGSSIGPGSNSHYFSVNKVSRNNIIGIGFEIVDQDNDFYHEAFASAKDYRRYWKDLNFEFKYLKNVNNFNFSSKIIYNRSLNYQWELDDSATPYNRPGRDLDNFHLNLKLTYFGNW